jgi:hypothetical protein
LYFLFKVYTTRHIHKKFNKTHIKEETDVATFIPNEQFKALGITNFKFVTMAWGSTFLPNLASPVNPKNNPQISKN